MKIEYGLIGMPLAHSLSPLIHAQLADYDYRLYPVTDAEMRRILEEKEFKGLNVTIPYKTAVLPFCDEISDRVKQTGCANTLVCQNGKIYADNTDVLGLREMLKGAGFLVRGRKAAILGSGGTSLTAQAVLKEMGAEKILVVSRHGPMTYDLFKKEHGDTQIIVNTTPVGMYPNENETPLKLEGFQALEGVADVIYRPAKTCLMREAIALSIPAAGGLTMLVCQAWHSAMAFTGHTISREKALNAYQMALEVLEEEK